MNSYGEGGPQKTPPESFENSLGRLADGERLLAEGGALKRGTAAAKRDRVFSFRRNEFATEVTGFVLAGVTFFALRGWLGFEVAVGVVLALIFARACLASVKR